MSESKLNLVASILTNSLGTTIIGHVASENVTSLLSMPTMMLIQRLQTKVVVLWLRYRPKIRI